MNSQIRKKLNEFAWRRIGCLALLFCFFINNNSDARMEDVVPRGDVLARSPATKEKSLKERIKEQNKKLFFCQLKSPPMQFLCNPDWDIEQIDGTTMIKISQEPYVTMSISPIDADVVYLEQLSRPFFEKKGLYASNFQKDVTSFADVDALQIKAFSKKEPEMRFLSYFFFYEDKLYNILFSVYPKKEWDEYKFLFRRIKESCLLERRRIE